MIAAHVGSSLVEAMQAIEITMPLMKPTTAARLILDLGKSFVLTGIALSRLTRSRRSFVFQGEYFFVYFELASKI